MIYRVYFNNTADFPQIWSIDEGSVETEVNVSNWRVYTGCTMKAGRAVDFSTVDSTREPKAWCEVGSSRLVIEDGVAVFEA